MNEYNDLLERLFSLQDETYRTFHKKLLCNESINVIGVRMPNLRKLAKEWKSDCNAQMSCHRRFALRGILPSGGQCGQADRQLGDVRLLYGTLHPRTQGGISALYRAVSQKRRGICRALCTRDAPALLHRRGVSAADFFRYGSVRLHEVLCSYGGGMAACGSSRQILR